MSRTIVTESELLDWINAELTKHEECANCSATAVLTLSDVDSEGCNWPSANLRCSGVPASVCMPMANQVIARARLRFNVK